MSAITQQEDKQYERKGIIFAVIFHAVLLLIFFFWIVLKKTNNEAGPGTAGVPINFGFNELGSGDNNSMDQVATQTDQTPQEAQEPVEATTEDANLTANNPTAETVVSETQKPSTTTPVTPTVKPTQTTTTPTTNPNAQMGSTTKPGVASGDGDSKLAGNQGNPNGSLDSRGYYGTPGNGGNGGNGALSMDGWHLEAEPKVENTEKEAGKVTFAIKIDSDGEILSLTVIEKQVSEALVKKCEYQIRNKMEFVKNQNNGTSAPTSTGKITFLFRVN